MPTVRRLDGRPGDMRGSLLFSRRSDAGQAVLEYVGIVVVLALVATLLVGVARRATQDGPAEVGFRLAICELAAGAGCTVADAVAAGVDLSGHTIDQARAGGLIIEGATFDDLRSLGLDVSGTQVLELALGYGVDLTGVPVTTLIDSGVVATGVTVRDLADLEVGLWGADPAGLAAWGADVGVLESITEAAGLGLALSPYTVAQLRDLGIELNPTGDVLTDVVAWTATDRFTETDLVAAGVDLSQITTADVLPSADAVFPGVGLRSLDAAGIDVAGLLAPEVVAIARGLFPDDPVISVRRPWGRDIVVVGDATVDGGPGNDRIYQLAGDAVIDPRGGRNEITILGGSTATVIDSNGATTVVTQPLPGTGRRGPGVDLRILDEGNSALGEFVVSLGANGTFGADLDGPGNRTFLVQEGARVDLAGIRSSDDDGEETVIVGGVLRDGSIALGRGDDRVQSTEGSRLVGVGIQMGSGEDVVELAGDLRGVWLDLGMGEDQVIVRDSATGRLRLADPEEGWVERGDDNVEEYDQLALPRGFRAVDGDVGAGLVRVDRDGSVVMSIGLDGDPDHVEQIVIMRPDGTLGEELQSIDPDVRGGGGGFLGFLGAVLSIAGIVTGLFPLTAAGVAVNSANAIANGADVFDVAVGAVTGLVGAGANIGWLGPLGQAVVSADNGDLLGTLLSGASAIGRAADIGALTALGRTGQGLRGAVTAVETGNALGAVSSLIDVAGTVTGTSNQRGFTQTRAAVDLVNTVVSASQGGLDATDLAQIALSGVTLADTFGAFIPPPPPPPDRDDDAGPRAQLPVPPLGRPLEYASVEIRGDPVPLEVGQTRVFDGDDGTRWHITNFGETTDDRGRTTSAVLRYRMFDADGNPVAVDGIDQTPVVDDGSNGRRVREVQRIEASPDGTSYVVEYSWTDADALDFFRLDPEFEPFSAEAWTPTPTTAVQTGLGVGASSLVNSSILRQRNPSLSFTDALRMQAPGQPLNVARDLATFGVTSQRITEDPFANLLVGGTIGSVVGVGSQELARRVLNPTANELMTRHQLGRFSRYLDTGDPAYLRGVNLATDPNIRFDAPVSNWTIGGINFGIPAANMAIDAGLDTAENLAVDAGLPVEGLSDNYFVDLVGDAAAVCLGVAVPIAVGTRRWRLPRDPCAFPAGQSAAARLVTDPPPGLDLGPFGEALVDTCSNENVILDAAQQFICSAGRNPNDGLPPTGPAAGLAPVNDRGVGGLEPGLAFDNAPVDTGALLDQMRTWQRELLVGGVQADQAAAVFNNRSQQLQDRFGLTPQEATEALGGTYSNAVGQRMVGPEIVGPAIVGPGIVGPAIVGPCERGMACWGNGPAGIQYVGPGDPAPSTVPGSTTAPVLNVPEPGMRGEPRPVTPPPARSDTGNWLWNTVTGAWDWWEQANAAAAQRFNDTPQQVDVGQRNRWFVPTTYEVEFPDGRRGVYDAASGDRVSGQGPANVPPLTLQSAPRSGLRIGPYVMPAGSGIGAPVPAF